MSIRKSMIITAVMLVSLFSVALAAKVDDFDKEDFNNLLAGQKDMSGAQLQGADLRGKDLSGVNFQGAELEEVDFRGANLSGVNFKNADLEEANLKGANITGANFSGAELEYTTWADGRVCAEDSVGGCW